MFRVSRLPFEGLLKKAYKTCVKHTILDLGHALLTHLEAPRIHKLHEGHPEGSWEHLGASCGPSGNHLWSSWELSGTSSEPYGNHSKVLRELSGPHGSLLAFTKNVWEEASETH